MKKTTTTKTTTTKSTTTKTATTDGGWFAAVPGLLWALTFADDPEGRFKNALVMAIRDYGIGTARTARAIEEIGAIDLALWRHSLGRADGGATKAERATADRAWNALAGRCGVARGFDGWLAARRTAPRLASAGGEHVEALLAALGETYGRGAVFLVVDDIIDRGAFNAKARSAA